MNDSSTSIWRLTWERFLENRGALLGLFMIIFFILVAVLADPLVSILGIDPNSQDILNRFAPPSQAHWLGLDEAGRDVLARLIYGTRISLLVAFVSAFAATLIGITVGSIAGYFGGWLDLLLMRFTDAMLSLPILPLLIIVAAIDFSKVPVFQFLISAEDPSVSKMILIFILFAWMTQARLVRGAILSVREREFVMAAQTQGFGAFSIISREILPNVLSPVIVSVSLEIGQAILFESALSFLGLGIQPPTPSWGNMMTHALESMNTAPLLVFFPGFLILLVVVSFNFLGDGLQDALDPKALKR